MDDASLIARSLEDGRSFEPIFDRHYSAIHRFLAVRAGVHAADDLASETFTIAFRRRGSYDLSRPNAAPWLYGIALNLLYRHRRSEIARKRMYAQVASRADEPNSLVADAFDKNGRLSLALKRLTEQDRDLIVLVAWAELTYDQLGDIFELPVGTIRSRLSRVRATLRESLSSTETTGTALDEGVIR